MKTFTFFTAFFFLLLIGSAGAKSEPNLKTVMINLEADMEAIVRALNYDDFLSIKARALAIANHEKPSMALRKKIMTFLGTEAGGVKKADS